MSSQNKTNFLKSNQRPSRKLSLLQVQKNKNFEEKTMRDLQFCISHIRKFLNIFLNSKFSNPSHFTTQEEIDSLKPISTPKFLLQADQMRLIHTTNRRIKNIIFTFGKQTFIESQLNQCYERQSDLKNAPSFHEYFRDSQRVLISAIFDIKKKLKNKQSSEIDESNIFSNTDFKMVPFQVKEKWIREELYCMMNLVKIEAINIYLEGLDFQKNYPLMYRQELSRNSEIKKQIQEYRTKYEKREIIKKRQKQKSFTVSLGNIKKWEKKKDFSLQKECYKKKNKTNLPKIIPIKNISISFKAENMQKKLRILR